MKRMILLLALVLFFCCPAHSKETLLDKEIINCERIGYPQWRDDCFESLPKSAKNYSLCLKFANTDRRSACVASYPPQSTADCQFNETPSEINSCLIALAQQSQNFLLCKEIADIQQRKECYACSTNPKSLPVCLEFRAKQLQDKSICDLLDSHSAKKSCLTQMTAKSTVVGCEDPQNFLDFKLCKQFSIAQNQTAPRSKKSGKHAKNSSCDPSAKQKEKSARIQKIKNRHAAIKEEKAQKIQTAKDMRAAKVEEIQARHAQRKEEKARKIQTAKDMRAAKVKEIQARHAQQKEEKAQKVQKTKHSHKAKSKNEPAKAIQTDNKIIDNEIDIKNALEEDVSNNSPEKINARTKKEDQSILPPPENSALSIPTEETPASEKKDEKTLKTQNKKSSGVSAQLVGFGCTKGFGAWTEPPPSRRQQIICDKENIETFKPLLNRCLANDRNNILIMSFDINKDACVTCADLNQWKEQVNHLYRAKKRLADSRYLYIKECKDRKF